MSATTPATIGVAWLVPAISEYPPPGAVLSMRAPGAKIRLLVSGRWLNEVIWSGPVV